MGARATCLPSSHASAFLAKSTQVMGGDPWVTWQVFWITHLMGPVPAWESHAPLLGITLRAMGLPWDSWERFFSLIKRDAGEKAPSVCPSPPTLGIGL